MSKRRTCFFRFPGADLRSLSLFRILLGLIVALDLFTRLPNLRDFYTDWGVLPRSALFDGLGNSWALSLHTASGQYSVMLGLWAVAFAFSVMLTIGYRTRLATFFSWLFFISILARNPAVTHAGDDLLRLALFWSIFTPLNAYFSVDRLLRPAKLEKTEILCPGATFLILQLMAVYLCSGLLKLHPIWDKDGSAIYLALHLDQLTTPFGAWLGNLPATLLRIMTKTTLLIELFAPFLVFFTWRKGFMRLIAIALFASFHLGLDLSFHLGLFPHLCIALWLALLPATFWNDLLPRLQKKFPSLVFFFAQLVRLRTTVGRSSNRLLATFWRGELRPEPVRLKLPLFLKLFSTASFILAMYWNVALYSERDRWYVPSPFYQIGMVLRLHQDWRLFAPFPYLDDGWYVVEADFANGARYDILNNKSVSFTKPDYVAPLYRDVMWTKYLSNLWNDEYADYRLYFGRYLCRKWNETHSALHQAQTFQLYYMLEPTKPPGVPIPAAQKVPVWKHYCVDRAQEWNT